jgi:hypothetical protein
MLFAFGAQRSGTWWLQRILTAHPRVSAVPSETDLFTDGIRPLLERFHHGARSSPSPNMLYVDRELLLDAARDFCDSVFAPWLEQSSTYLSERSPRHSEAVDLMAAVYPDARFVQIIRDGRDVARSLVARDWGPASVGEAAVIWRDAVASARAAAPPERYREVRYEELLADPPGQIAALYRWLELPVDDSVVEGAMGEARRPLNQDPDDPRLASGKWRDHFSPSDLAEFEAEAGDLLDELGYERAAPRDTASRGAPAAAPTGAPAAAPTGRRSLLGRLRRGRPAEPAPRGLRLDVGGVLADAQRVVDRFLGALQTGDGRGLRAVLDGDAVLRVIGSAGEETVYGAEGVAATLEGDEAWGGDQLRGEIHPGVPNFSLVLLYRLSGGELTWRIVQLGTRGQSVVSVTVYPLAAAESAEIASAT